MGCSQCFPFLLWLVTEMDLWVTVLVCRRHGIHPDEYLRDILERLPKAKTSELRTLTPAG